MENVFENRFINPPEEIAMVYSPKSYAPKNMANNALSKYRYIGSAKSAIENLIEYLNSHLIGNDFRPSSFSSFLINRYAHEIILASNRA